MVKKLASISIVAGAAVISACFGEGPVPTPPAKATILFTGTPIPNCGASGTYIGPVAIGAGSGFVSTLPYTQSGGGFDCNGGGGGPPPSQEEDIFAFNRDGGTLMKIGSAGQSNQNLHARLTTTPTGVAYVYGAQSNGQAIVQPGNVMIGSNMGGVADPLGIAQVGSDLYVELGTNGVTTGQSEPDNPEYPCCGGNMGGANNTMASIYKVGSASPLQISAVCSTLDTCMVGNANDLIYFERPVSGTELWQLTLLPVAGTTPTKVASLSNGGEVPVGLDANDTTVAFSTSLTCSLMNQSDQCNVNECNVFAYDIASGMLKTLLSTRQWGCMDAKLADGYVYFTIIGYASRTEHMFGKGIGRVSIADKTFESLNLGIQGDAAGPRRIYPSAGRLYLVDPLVMARIFATDLDGKMDFTP